MPDGMRANVPESAGPRVVLARETDVEAWCQKLHCTEAQLHRAVKAVGTAPESVAAHLQKKYGAKRN